jgi:hypothetical protein
VVASAAEVPGAGGTPQGATGVEVADADPRLGDSAGSLLQDLVVRGASAGAPGSAALGDAAPAPRVLECHGFRDICTVLIRFSRLSALAHQLEAGGG